jgi:flavin reductase (DIM6/NTAB) family NADH-FMN oxidoreductase RutF
MIGANPEESAFMITSEKFREVMGTFATGITVVTTRGLDGEVYGLTVNSFASVSLDPLLVLVCFDNRLSSLPHFEASGKFGISILSDGQEEVSRIFAKKGSERPIELFFEGPSGLPLIRKALATLECETVATFPGGDHQIYLGRVIAADVHEAQNASKPLLYFRGKYQHLQ